MSACTAQARVPPPDALLGAFSQLRGSWRFVGVPGICPARTCADSGARDPSRLRWNLNALRRIRRDADQ